MDAILAISLKLTLVVFMAGSLLGMGLGLRLEDASRGLRNPRFLVQGLVFAFLLGPLLAWLVARLLGLEQPYADGLLLLGLAPCAPFLPLLVERARGDMGHAPAMLVLTAAGTLVVMPLALPRLVPDLAVDAWTIARPLLWLMLLPLAVGLTVFRVAPAFAVSVQPAVRRATGIAAVALLAVCLVLYGRGFLGSVGSFATGAQFVFLGLLATAGYALPRGLGQGQRSVLALGLATRNVGAAAAPLLAATGIDERTMVMVVLGVPVQIVCSFLAAAWFARAARRIPA